MHGRCRPASHAVVEPSSTAPRIEKYWRLKFPARRKNNLVSAADEYETLLTDAVRLRLRATYRLR